MDIFTVDGKKLVHRKRLTIEMGENNCREAPEETERDPKCR